MFPAIVFLVATAHFAFIVYLLIGGFVAVRWRRTIWPYLLTVSWAAASVLLRWESPLTSLEQWGRRQADMLALPSAGFVAHYLTGVLYPESWAGPVELVVFVVVTASLVVFVASSWRRSSVTDHDGVSRRA
jgi:hypothetical protein